MAESVEAALEAETALEVGVEAALGVEVEAALALALGVAAAAAAGQRAYVEFAECRPLRLRG